MTGAQAPDARRPAAPLMKVGCWPGTVSPLAWWRHRPTHARHPRRRSPRAMSRPMRRSWGSEPRAHALSPESRPARTSHPRDARHLPGPAATSWSQALRFRVAARDDPLPSHRRGTSGPVPDRSGVTTSRRSPTGRMRSSHPARCDGAARRFGRPARAARDRENPGSGEPFWTPSRSGYMPELAQISGITS